MREVGGEAGVPGIAMSGFGSDEDIRLSRQAGRPQQGTTRDGLVDWLRLHLGPQLAAEALDERAVGKIRASPGGSQRCRPPERLHLLR